MKTHAKTRSREKKASEDSDLRGFAPSRENLHIDGWPTAQLQEVCSFLSGGTPSKQKPEFWIGSIPWVSPKDMKKPRLSDVVDHISVAALEDGSSLAPAGSIFIVIRGMILAKDVPVALAEVPMAFNQDMKAIVSGSRLEPSFLLYALMAFKRAMFQKVGRSAHGTMTLMTNDLAEFAIPVPPLSEQRRIAGVLGLVQRAVEQQERLRTLVAELKQTLLHHLFTHGLLGEPQKPTDLGPIPQSWEPTPLGTCCDILNGSLSYTDFLATTSADDADSVECMGVKVSDMNLPGNENEFVTANLIRRLPKAFAQRKLIPPNTVVFPKRGAAIATNKKRRTTIWTVLDPNLIGLLAKDVLDPLFLFYWSQTFDLRKITDPGATPQLNKKDLVPLLMPLPTDIAEQREIANAIGCVDSKLRCHQRKHSALTSLFRTLLHQLMTAQLRVADLDVESLLAPAVPDQPPPRREPY